MGKRLRIPAYQASFLSSLERIGLTSSHWCTFFFSKSKPKGTENLYLDIYSHILDFHFSFDQKLNAYLQEVQTSFTDRAFANIKM